MPAAIELPRLRRELKLYLERMEVTPTAFARDNGVNQSTVQRFLAGDTKTVTPRMRPLLVYAGIELDSRITLSAKPVMEHPRIRQALERVWDGREQTVQVLAEFIEAVGPVIQQSLSASPGPRPGTGEGR